MSEGRTRSPRQRLAALLERADELLADESGMVVCWHEFDDEQILRSECVQCCVEAAMEALRHV
jgi:hypothetical protein